MLFSYEECDDCNHAGSQLENDLASFLSLPRALARIPSRKGFPKIKSAVSQQAFAQIQGDERKLYVYEPTEGEGIRTQDDGNGNIELTVKTPTHRPLNVAKALGRMAMFSYPRERAGFDVLRDWVCGAYNWFPVPMVVVHIPVPRGINTQTIGFWCHSYTRVPGRNVIRFFFVYSTFCTIVPIALDRQALPDGLPLIDYPQPIAREMMKSTSVFSIASDFVEPEGDGKALISYTERVKVASPPGSPRGE
jgi:hypothetical protein